MIPTILNSTTPVILVTLFVFAVLCVLGIAALGGRRRPLNAFQATDYVAKPLLTKWEAKAFLDLSATLPAGYSACPQVRLADMLELRVGNPSRRRSALNRVAKKSVDFAIIDGSGRVALVIELDDRTHAKGDRIERDGMVDVVMKQCGIPIVHVKPGQKASAVAQISRLPAPA